MDSFEYSCPFAPLLLFMARNKHMPRRGSWSLAPGDPCELSVPRCLCFCFSTVGFSALLSLFHSRFLLSSQLPNPLFDINLHLQAPFDPLIISLLFLSSRPLLSPSTSLLLVFICSPLALTQRQCLKSSPPIHTTTCFPVFWSSLLLFFSVSSRPLPTPKAQ